MSESLIKRLEYLGIADMDYLSARILLINGLTHTGLSKAAEAFEKLFKLFLIIEAKITENKHLTQKDLKQYEHKLVKLFKVVMLKLPEKTYHQSVENFFQQLENAYRTRYPESWRDAMFINNLEDLDKLYCYFRNNITINFPKEEQEKIRLFGTFIMKAYNKDVIGYIKKLDGMSPKEAISRHNKYINEFNIDLNQLL
ncbi:MAG: hypothetical protein HYW63_00280 [Candidatus Levybacteria bacterium]|nr:hypothetical protein [Candidatus Levybacteria bacterium]